LKYLIYILLFLTSFNGIAHSYLDKESNKIDSLTLAIERSLEDQSKIDLLTELGALYTKSNSDSLYPISKKLLRLSEKINNKCSEADAYHYMGNYYYKINEYDTAFVYFNTSLSIRQKQCGKKKVASSYFQLGNIKSRIADYDEAYSYYFKSLNLSEEIEDFEFVAGIHANMGLIDVGREKFKSAREHYQKSLEFEEAAGESIDLGNIYNNLGGLYQTQEIFDPALVYFQKAMSVYQRMDYKVGLAHGYNNIGIIYYHQEKEDSCMIYFLKSLEMRNQIGEKSSISQSYNNIGILYMYQGNFTDAVKYADSALSVAKDVGLKEEVSDAYLNLYEIYYEKEDYFNSVVNLKFYTDYKDSMVSEQSERLISEMEAKYETVKKEKEIQQQNIDLKQKSESITRQSEVIVVGAILGLLLLFLLFIAYNKNKLTKKQNLIITEQKQEVESKNKEITDSITYAKRIQSAILPPEKVVKEHLKNSFILYKPKDIVAGDFYWLEQKDGKVLFAAADCTGHGVPGAMVSVVCNNALNRSVREHDLTDPGKILDKTREIVIEEFEKSEEEVNDGMDIAICSLENNLLKYAGAHNPLWLIRNGEVLETKANKQPIGKFDDQEPYKSHQIELQKGDSIYIFSDGYIDQFGGEKGKKLKTPAFRDLLVSIQDKSMDKQKIILDESFESWKGEIDQIDDVCIIGVRV
jgi:serine phosphatase RsbU (regulator of sigma subunit)/uncharacterized protein HemY